MIVGQYDPDHPGLRDGAVADRARAGSSHPRPRISRPPTAAAKAHTMRKLFGRR
jgi:hypothetical protein